MEAAAIERIEELRYIISRDTHAMLKARKSKGSGDGDVKALERNIAEMKKEFEKALEDFKADGFEYALMGEKRINEIHGRFMRLSQDERNAALSGEGEGARLIDEIDDVLKENYDGRGKVADFLISLNVIMERSDSERVRKFIEGYLDSAVFQIRRGTDVLDIELFAEAAEELGFVCRIEGKTCELRQHSGHGHAPVLDLAAIGRIGEISKIGGRIGKIGIGGIGKMGKVFDRIGLFGTKKEEEKETKPSAPASASVPAPEATSVTAKAQTKSPAQPVQPQLVQLQSQAQPPQPSVQQPQPQQIQQPQTVQAAQPPGSSEPSGPSEAKMDSGHPDLEEIDRKIAVILQNKKMQRWVLNTFKDDAERQEYEKAQAVLVNLMRLKKEMLKKQHHQ